MTKSKNRLEGGEPTAIPRQATLKSEVSKETAPISETDVIGKPNGPEVVAALFSEQMGARGPFETTGEAYELSSGEKEELVTKLTSELTRIKKEISIFDEGDINIFLALKSREKELEEKLEAIQRGEIVNIAELLTSLQAVSDEASQKTHLSEEQSGQLLDPYSARTKIKTSMQVPLILPENPAVTDNSFASETPETEEELTATSIAMDEGAEIAAKALTSQTEVQEAIEGLKKQLTQETPGKHRDGIERALQIYTNRAEEIAQADTSSPAETPLVTSPEPTNELSPEERQRQTYLKIIEIALEKSEAKFGQIQKIIKLFLKKGQTIPAETLVKLRERWPNEMERLFPAERLAPAPENQQPTPATPEPVLSLQQSIEKAQKALTDESDPEKRHHLETALSTLLAQAAEIATANLRLGEWEPDEPTTPATPAENTPAVASNTETAISAPLLSEMPNPMDQEITVSEPKPIIPPEERRFKAGHGPEGEVSDPTLDKNLSRDEWIDDADKETTPLWTRPPKKRPGRLKSFLNKVALFGLLSGAQPTTQPPQFDTGPASHSPDTEDRAPSASSEPPAETTPMTAETENSDQEWWNRGEVKYDPGHNSITRIVAEHFKANPAVFKFSSKNISDTEAVNFARSVAIDNGLINIGLGEKALGMFIDVQMNQDNEPIIVLYDKNHKKITLAEAQKAGLVYDLSAQSPKIAPETTTTPTAEFQPSKGSAEASSTVSAELNPNIEAPEAFSLPFGERAATVAAIEINDDSAAALSAKSFQAKIAKLSHPSQQLVEVFQNFVLDLRSQDKERIRHGLAVLNNQYEVDLQFPELQIKNEQLNLKISQMGNNVPDDTKKRYADAVFYSRRLNNMIKGGKAQSLNQIKSAARKAQEVIAAALITTNA